MKRSSKIRLTLTYDKNTLLFKSFKIFHYTEFGTRNAIILFRCIRLFIRYT